MERSGREFKQETKANREAEKQMRRRNWEMKKRMPRKECHERRKGLIQPDMGHLFVSTFPSKPPGVVADTHTTAKRTKTTICE